MGAGPGSGLGHCGLACSPGPMPSGEPSRETGSAHWGVRGAYAHTGVGPSTRTTLLGCPAASPPFQGCAQGTQHSVSLKAAMGRTRGPHPLCGDSSSGRTSAGQACQVLVQAGQGLGPERDRRCPWAPSLAPTCSRMPSRCHSISGAGSASTEHSRTSCPGARPTTERGPRGPITFGGAGGRERA